MLFPVSGIAHNLPHEIEMQESVEIISCYIMNSMAIFFIRLIVPNRQKPKIILLLLVGYAKQAPILK